MIIRGSQRDIIYLGWPIVSSYMSQNVGDGEGCGTSANEYSCALTAHGAQKNVEDLTPYLTFGLGLVHLNDLY